MIGNVKEAEIRYKSSRYVSVGCVRGKLRSSHSFSDLCAIAHIHSVQDFGGGGGGDCVSACECVQGFLPTLTCAVFCKTHENIILLPLGFYSFYLLEKNKEIVKEILTEETLTEQGERVFTLGKSQPVQSAMGQLTRELRLVIEDASFVFRQSRA